MLEYKHIAREVTRLLMRLTEEACIEAIGERDAHGLDAEPQVFAFQNDPYAGAVRIIVDGKVVFERNFRVNVVYN